ncbi:unnamed protein product [Phaeothamnion confervicola]
MLLFTLSHCKTVPAMAYAERFAARAAAANVTYRPVAVVRSPFRERFGTPRQPGVTAGAAGGGAAAGEIVFFPGHGYEEALEDSEGFDMLWVLSHMHLNSSGWRPKVRPPRLADERKGVFSTRAPHRPNAVALSAVRVRRVRAADGIVEIEGGLDLLDGTPVLDVKPYIPYIDSFPDARAGWVDALGSGNEHNLQPDHLSTFSAGAALAYRNKH